MNRRIFLKTSALGIALASTGTRTAFAQAAAYPTKPVSIVVPYAPGGQGDVFARLLSEPLSQVLGQSVVVENKPGASGMLGTRNIIREAADGYHLLMGQTGEIAIVPNVNQQAGYNTLEDLAPVVLVGDSPLVFIAPKNASYNTIEEFIALAKKDKGSMAYASSGTATPGHLAAAALALGTGTEMTHVPYKGAGQAMTDVIGGQVNGFFSSAAAALTHIKAGTVKALAVSSLKRASSLPDVPTINETVLPGFNYSLWGGIFAPKQTPQEIVALLNQRINDLLGASPLRERFDADGTAVDRNTPEQFTEFVKSQVTKYQEVIKATGITVS
jgi:tripartite-type tricarboxylate transporter receptor subunit TctC